MDANSLYPTAITQLKGFPKGAPKNISKKDLDSKYFQQVADEYFVKIKVLSVGLKYNFPLLNYVNEIGERIWSNDLVGKTIYVDRIMLEGLVKYHKIEYVCKAGVMFNEGYNTKVVDVVKKFYALRLKYKAENNPVELLYKLILNNIYGKNIEKPKEHKMVWNTGKQVEIDEVHRKYGACQPIITQIRPGMFKIKVKLGFDTNHRSTPQCGSLILSQSKIIMMDPMSMVDDHIKYTDTDSMFIDEEGLKILKTKRPELFGNGLGQFKIEQHMGTDNMYIEEGMFLAKKLYYVKEVNTMEKYIIK